MSCQIYKTLGVQNLFYHSMTALKFGGFLAPTVTSFQSFLNVKNCFGTSGIHRIFKLRPNCGGGRGRQKLKKTQKCLSMEIIKVTELLCGSNISMEYIGC